MHTATKNVYRDRINFAKIQTSIPIPNLIEIQKKSYERFLQMRVLPQDREEAGLQSVFKSVFPITDLRENCSLEFVEYSIGNWECKCGRLVGLDKLGRPCTFCAMTIITDPRGDREIHCPKCGHLNENRPVTCETCDEPVGLKLKYDVDECQERGMTFAVPLKVTIRLVAWDDAEGSQAMGREGAGGLFRGNPDHDRQRHLHHQWHRAGDRLAAAPLSRDLLRHEHLHDHQCCG